MAQPASLEAFYNSGSGIQVGIVTGFNVTTGAVTSIRFFDDSDPASDWIATAGTMPVLDTNATGASDLAVGKYMLAS